MPDVTLNNIPVTFIRNAKNEDVTDPRILGQLKVFTREQLKPHCVAYTAAGKIAVKLGGWRGKLSSWPYVTVRRPGAAANRLYFKPPLTIPDDQEELDDIIAKAIDCWYEPMTVDKSEDGTLFVD